MDLMSTNAKGRFIRGKKLLVFGSCVAKEHPEFLEKFGDYTKLSFCPEKEHINMAFYKLIAMISVAEELVILTVDGSPHCVQLHYIAEELLKYSEKKFAVKHFVIEKGNIVGISSRSVRLSRYLSKIEKMLDGSV